MGISDGLPLLMPSTLLSRWSILTWAVFLTVDMTNFHLRLVNGPMAHPLDQLIQRIGLKLQA